MSDGNKTDEGSLRKQKNVKKSREIKFDVLRKKYPGLSDEELKGIANNVLTPGLDPAFQILASINQSYTDIPTYGSVDKNLLDRLKSDLDAQTKENDSLKKENVALKKDKNTLQERLDKKIEESSGLKEEVERLKEDNRSLRSEKITLKGENDRFRKESLQKDPVISGLREMEKTLDRRILDLEKEISALREEKEALEASLSEAVCEMEDLRNRAPAPREAVDDEGGRLAFGDIGTVRRTDPDILESSLFLYHKYKVTMARDGSRMTFSPDVEGKVSCSEGRIRIPKLGQMLPFSGEKEYRVISGNGTTMIVELL